MPYKDIEKQRAAARERQRKHREGSPRSFTLKGVTKGVTGVTGVTDREGVTSQDGGQGVTGVTQIEGVTGVTGCDTGRDKAKRQGVTEGVTDREKNRMAMVKVAPVLGIPRQELDARWRHLADYIQEPCPGMPRLERMQRIAGSLGRYADQVYFGLGVDSAISMEEVGKVIGILPPLIGRV